MLRYNMHVHTNNSPDCSFSANDMCQSAFEAGFNGIAICDHCSGSEFISFDSYRIVKNSFADAKRLKAEFLGKMDVLFGIEFDEMTWGTNFVNRTLSSYKFDVVLASVHKIHRKDGSGHLSRMDFSTLKKEEVTDCIHQYFKDVLDTAKFCDFDVLAHLTLIMRYVCEKYKISVDIQEFYPVIDEILKTIIKRDKALEVNTSQYSGLGLMPQKEILCRYKNFGGTKVVIGTDAHSPQKINFGFDFAIKTLLDCGFDSYYYYKERKPYKESIL